MGQWLLNGSGWTRTYIGSVTLVMQLHMMQAILSTYNYLDTNQSLYSFLSTYTYVDSNRTAIGSGTSISSVASAGNSVVHGSGPRRGARLGAGSGGSNSVVRGSAGVGAINGVHENAYAYVQFRIIVSLPFVAMPLSYRAP